MPIRWEASGCRILCWWIQVAMVLLRLLIPKLLLRKAPRTLRQSSRKLLVGLRVVSRSSGRLPAIWVTRLYAKIMGTSALEQLLRSESWIHGLRPFQLFFSGVTFRRTPIQCARLAPSHSQTRERRFWMALAR